MKLLPVGLFYFISVHFVTVHNCDYDYTHSHLRRDLPYYFPLLQILKTSAFEHAISAL